MGGKNQLKNVVSHHTILHVPFLSVEDDLEYDQPFGRITMFYMGMDNDADDKKRKYWNQNKKVAKAALNAKRSNVGGSLRKTFRGTYYCLTRKRILYCYYYHYFILTIAKSILNNTAYYYS